MNKQLPYASSSRSISGYSESTVAKSEKSDCVVCAIASASGMDYDKSHKFVSNVFKRKPKSPTYRFGPIMDSLARSGKKINRKKISEITDLTLGKSRMTVGKFIKLHNIGSYIISVNGHAFTIKDGVVIGNKEDSEKKRRIVCGAWRIGK